EHDAGRTAPAWRAGRRLRSLRSELRPKSFASQANRLVNKSLATATRFKGTRRNLAAVSSFPACFGKPKPAKRPFSRCFCLKMGEDFAILMLNKRLGCRARHGGILELPCKWKASGVATSRPTARAS